MRTGRNHSEPPIRVVVADDVPEMLVELAEVVDSADDMELVGTASDGVEAILRAENEEPDVIVLDLRMPLLDGITVARRITLTLADVGVVIHSAYPDDSLRQDAERAGAATYLVKGATDAELLDAIRYAAASRVARL